MRARANLALDRQAATDSVHTDAHLSFCFRSLRRLLGDDAENSETVGVCYRSIGKECIAGWHRRRYQVSEASIFTLPTASYENNDPYIIDSAESATAARQPPQPTWVYLP